GRREAWSGRILWRRRRAVGNGRRDSHRDCLLAAQPERRRRPSTLAGVIAAEKSVEYDWATDRGIIAGTGVVGRSLSLTLTAGLLLAAAMSSPGYAEQGRMQGYEFEFTSIDGEKLPLSQYRGHPVLVVNTASFCGFTPQ